MVRQIIQQLLEHQGEISSLYLSKLIQQPISIIEDQLEALEGTYPDLLSLNYNHDATASFMVVKITEGGEEKARQLLSGTLF